MLCGAPSCRRYRRMKENLLREAGRLSIEVALREVNETGRLSEFNPLSLPRLYLDGDLVASQNPPDKAALQNWFKEHGYA